MNPAGFGHDGFDEAVDFIGFEQRQNVATVDDFVGFRVVANQHTVALAVDLVQRERATFGRVEREIVPPRFRVKCPGEEHSQMLREEP